MEIYEALNVALSKMMESPTEQWLRKWLTECFADMKRTPQLLVEKRQRLNGKVYKYCPIYDSSDKRQYYIENIEQSKVHLSQLSCFNDPFDTSLTISAEEVIRSFIQKMLNKGAVKMDKKLVTVLPIIIMLLSDSSDNQRENNLARMMIHSFEERPELIQSSQTSEELMAIFLETMTKLLTNKELSIEETESYTDDASDPMFTRSLFRGLMNSKKILQYFGANVKDKDLNEFLNIMNGKHPAVMKYTREFDKMLHVARPELLKAMREMQKSINEKVYVSCFSEKSNSPLMWAHYSNEHKGFCVEYDLNKPQDQTFLINLHPVIYTKIRGRIPSSLFDVTKTGEVIPAPSNASTIDIICAMLKKSNIWEYEEEWRFVAPDGIERENLDELRVDCISKIILGCRTEEKYVSRIQQICEDRGWNLSRMKLDDYTYELHEEVLQKN